MNTTKNNHARKAIIVNEGARFQAAKDAKDQLKKEKLSESDRLILARNLRVIFDKCVEKNPSLKMNRIFIEAFGERSGDSSYKKSSRLIPKQPLEVSAEKLSATGDKYRKLALTLAQHIEVPTGSTEDDKAIYAILRLIEGSSFDSISAHQDRYEQEYRNEISNRLRGLAEKIAKKVDLDWMRTWTKNHFVAAYGRTGVLSIIYHSSWNDEGTLELSGPINNCLAPCVRLGTVTTQIPIQNYMDIEVDDEKDGESDAEKIRRALAKKLGEPIDSEYDDWAILDTLENSEHWISSQDNTLGYKTKRLLDLEIRFDAASNSWVPCLLLRFEFKDGFVLDVKEYIDRNHDKDLEEVFSFGINDGACLAQKISDKAYRIFFLFTTDLDSEGGAWKQVNSSWATDDFRGLCDNEGTHPLDERFFSFLLQTEDKTSWSFNSSIERRFPFDDGFEDGEYFVKAPDGSIAAKILINLAYAKGEKRLDNLLIKDATHKYKMLKEYSERVTKKYEDAISKL
jgi:hypothetical protein